MKYVRSDRLLKGERINIDCKKLGKNQGFNEDGYDEKVIESLNE